MKIPSKKIIAYAEKAAQELEQIEITATPNFYFDTSEASTNNIDDSFIESLRQGNDLQKNYTDNYLS